MRATTNQPNPAAVVMRSGSFLAQPLEFLSFTLGQDKYGIDIQKIQELRDYDTVTRIVNAPKHTKGVVDSVSDVIPLSPEQIKPAPEMGAVLDTDDLIGLGTRHEHMLILVDIDKLMLSADMGLIQKLAV